MKIRKNGKVVNLTETDLRRIVKKTLNEQTTGSTESSVGNSMSRVKLDSGVEIGEEFVGEYKKVKLEITGPKKEVSEVKRNLKLNGCIITGNPSSSVQSNGMTTFVSDYLIPSDLDYTSL